jgi:hypothetical protein
LHCATSDSADERLGAAPEHGKAAVQRDHVTTAAGTRSSRDRSGIGPAVLLRWRRFTSV